MPSQPQAPFLLTPFFSPRPWGATSLAPWYQMPEGEERVGEAWLTGPQSRVATGPQAGRTLAEVMESDPAGLVGPQTGGAEENRGSPDYPLLVKMIFPADKLSVQVHPGDAQARRAGSQRGKTECWYIVQAEPDATIAVGLHDSVTAEQVRAAIADETVENLLVEIPVAAGDMLYVEHGTVHAIEAGVVVLEVQQQSDLTYRMYDYGRGRELHVEEAMAALRLETPSGKVAPVTDADGVVTLIERPHFILREHRLSAGGSKTFRAAEDAPTTLVLLSGSAAGTYARDGRDGGENLRLEPGIAAVVPAGAELAVTAGATGDLVRVIEIVPGPALFS